MPEIIEACVDFDGRLLESAFSDSSDAELELHVASCLACRAAGEGYRATARALGAALSEPLTSVEGTGVRGRRARSSRSKLGWFLAAASLLAAALLWRIEAAEPIRWIAGPGAVVRSLAPDRARIEAGTATFEVDRKPFVLEAPVGEIRAIDASFRVEIAGAKDVTVDVSRGSVRWIVGEQETAVGVGESVSRGIQLGSDRETSPPAGLVDAEGVSPSRTNGVGTESPAGFEIQGRVVDRENDAPIAGAEVILCARKDGQPPMEARAVTGADGTVLARSRPLEDSVAERWPFNVQPSWRTTCLTVIVPGFAPHVESPVERFFHDSPLDIGRTIDLGLFRLSRGARVSGRVVLAAGRIPIAGARILLVEDAPTTFPGSFIGQQAHEVARSTPNGDFLLDAQVAPRSPGRQHWLFALTPEGIGWRDLEVAGAVSEVGDVEISIGAAGAMDTYVQDTEGRPIPDATVWADPRFDPLHPRDSTGDHVISMGMVTDDGLRSVFEQRTDSAGRVHFGLLPMRDGRTLYDVAASREGFVQNAQNDVRIEAGSTGVVRITLQADRPRSVSGFVKSEDGSPVEGAVVETGNSKGPLRCTSDAAGAFHIEGLMASSRGAGFRVNKSGLGELRRNVSFPNAEDVVGLEFVLKRAHPISGRLVDQHGAPVSAAEMGIRQGNQWIPLKGERTGPDGEFRFDDATEGEWELGIWAPEPATDWISAWTKRTVHGGDAELRVVLERDERFKSRLVVEIVDDVTGAPLDPIAVEALPFRMKAGTSWTLPKTKMGHGLATIEPIYAGDWVLWVRTPAHAIARQMMHVDEGTAETAFTVRVGRPAILSGRVEFDGISPVRSVCLLFLIGDGDRPGGNDWRGGSLLDSYIRVQPDGSFRLENVTPGHWVVTLRNEGLLAKKTVEVPSGSETQIVLHPTPGAQLDFRTTAPSPGDAVQFCIAEGDEVEWRNAMRLGAMKGKDVAYTETVQPGRVRWKVEFPVDNRLGASAAAATQEGELRVSAGEEIEVLVPVVPKK